MKKSAGILLMAVVITWIFTPVYAENTLPEIPGEIITGRVIDSGTNLPMEYVNVAVYNAADSSLVTGAITSPDGQFKIGKLAKGDYFIRLTFMGYIDLFTDKIPLGTKTQQYNLGDLKLQVSKVELDEVSVVTERKRVEYLIDKRVINVGQDIVAKGGTAVDVLENTPSIQVDAQGNVSLRGSYDYIVLLDGKPSVMKGSEVLKTINASSVKQIEVITNPSARYEADGKAGIINIIRKKEKMQGLSGTANASWGSADKQSGGTLINYRINKVNTYIGLDYASNIFRNDIIINNLSFLESGNQSINEKIEEYNCNDNLSGKAGIDFDMDEKNSFSISGNFGEQGYDRGSHAKYNIHNQGDEQKQYFSSRSDLDVMGYVPALNLDYSHKIAENHSLSISNSYSAWNGKDFNMLSEYYTDNTYNAMGQNSSLKYKKRNFNYQYRINVDYKRPLNTGTLETGFQYRLENRWDDLTFENLDTSAMEWVVNPVNTHRLNYVNDIYSGYATYSDKLAGIGYMIGLRSEYFTRRITFSNDDEPYDFKKAMFYPSLHFSKSVNDKHQFQLSYSRRINRPQPWILNKTPHFIDPNNIFIGSPDIEPEFTDAFEFNYRLVYKILTLSTQSYFRSTSNSFSARRTLGNNGIMVHELINANSQKSYGMELGMDFNFFKWWQLSSGANLYHYTLEAQLSNGPSTKRANSFDARLISNFSLKRGTRIQAIGYMRGPTMDAQGENDGFYTMNLALSQTLMKGKLNLSLSAQNIFDSIKFDYSASGSNYKNNYLIEVEGLNLQLTASYSFNNFQNKQRGRSDDTSFKGGGAF